MAAHGDGEISAVLLRSAKGAQGRDEGGNGIHACDGSICRTGGGLGVRASNGRRKPCNWTQRADRQRGVVRGHDPRRRGSGGTEIICSELSRGRTHGHRGASWKGFHGYL